MATDELLKELLGQGKKREIDPLRYPRLIWRKKHLVAAPLVVAWVIAAIGVNTIPPTYIATSSVAIQHDANFTRDLSMLLDQQANRRQQEVSNLGEVRADLRNQDFLDDIIATLALDQTPVLREKAERLVTGPLAGLDVEDVVRRLAAEEVRERTDAYLGTGGVYNIRTQDHDPTTAYLLNRVITQKFVDMRRQRELAEVTAKGDFSDEQVAIYKEKLHRAETELERFQGTQQQTLAEGNPVSASNVILAQEVMRTYEQELANLENQVDQTRSQLRGLFGVVPTSDRLLSDRDLRALNNKQIHSMLQNLITYLGQQRLQGSLTDLVEDASVGADRQAYRDRLATLAGQVYAGNSPRERELIVNYYYRLMLVSSFQEVVDTLTRYVGNYRQNMGGQPAYQAELLRRQSEVSKYREFLDAFQQQSTSAQITRAIQSSQLATRIEVRDQAVKPIQPVKPNKPRLQVMFVLVGLVTGLAVVFLLEFFNRSFGDVKDVEAFLGVPVLGTIPPLARGPGKARQQRRKNTLLWILAMIVFAMAMAGSMVFIKGMNSRIELHLDREAAEELIP